MIATVGTIVGAWIITLFLSTLMAGILGAGTIGKALIQILSMSGVAAALVSMGYLTLIGAGVFVAVLIVLKAAVSLLFLLYFYKALQGELGEETQWATEIAKEGDQEFIEAMTSLPSTELKEVSIIAESKGELRELTVERSEEYNE